jgi:hypothetical protein
MRISLYVRQPLRVNVFNWDAFVAMFLRHSSLTVVYDKSNAVSFDNSGKAVNTQPSTPVLPLSNLQFRDFEINMSTEWNKIVLNKRICEFISKQCSLQSLSIHCLSLESETIIKLSNLL